MADLESLIFDPSSSPVSVNNQVSYEVEAFEYTPARAKTEWAESADTNGGLPTNEDHYTNAEATLRIRVPSQAAMDTALDLVNAIVAKGQKARRMVMEGERGLPVTWTPAGSTYAGTLYLLEADDWNVPKTHSGDDAGYFLSEPVLSVHLTFAPGVESAQRTITEITSTDPVVSFPIPDILGDLRTLAKLTVTDGSAFTLVVNLVTNPSVEVNTTGWTGVGGAISRVTTQFLRGVASLQNVATGGLAYAGASGPIPTLGVVHSAMVAVRVPNAGDYYLRTQNSAGTWSETGDTVTLVANQWTWLRAEEFIPANADAVQFRLYKTSGTFAASETFHMDAFMLVHAATVGEYVDGTQPGGTWDGTAHASTSRQLGRINRIPNPSFETGVGEWVATGAGSILQSEAFVVAGEYGASVESTEGDDDGAKTALIPITGGNTYTLAISALVPSGQLFRFRVERIDAAGANIDYGTSPDFIGAEPGDSSRVRIDLDGESALIDAFEIEREQDLGPVDGEEGGTEVTYSAMETVRRNYVDNGHFDVDVGGWDEVFSSISRDTFPYRA